MSDKQVKTYTFLSDVEIAAMFKARGFFYDLIVPGRAEPVPCRNILEIYSSTVRTQKLNEMEVDAVFVMMNPGSSTPLFDTPIPVTLEEMGSILVDPVRMQAKPDKTQYQVMRLMNVLGWNFVRILNLSDIREPKSDLFHSNYKDLEEKYGIEAHSIFSLIRTNERDGFLPSHVPVVFAWGVGREIAPLAKRYGPTIHANQIFGKKKNGYLYYHPLPQQHQRVKEWFYTMAKQLETALIRNT